MSIVSAPQTESELLRRTRRIAGCTLKELATQLSLDVPTNLRHAKGWTGQLIEQCLGADAGSHALPDFQALSIELKTIPLNAAHQPKESTYVCTVPFDTQIEACWEQAWIRKKLSRVLWLPIEAEPSIPIEQRRIGNAILWQPTPEQEQVLAQDWYEHMELISIGRIDEISAHHGTYLQIRPKAANHRALRQITDADGQRSQTLPRGFYLRSSFTAQILAQHYANA